MAAAMTLPFTTDSESGFFHHDDPVTEVFPPYQSPTFQYAALPAFVPPSRTSWPSNVGVRLQSRSHSFEFPTAFPNSPSTLWSSPSVTHSPEQMYFQHSPTAMYSPAQAATHGLAARLGHSLTTKRARSSSYPPVGSVHTISSPDSSQSGSSRASSPSSLDLTAFGYLNASGTWSCSYPGCTSKAVFTRGCDLRKHHKRHTKSFFCGYPGCPQTHGGGFSSKKDLARHEAKHAPSIICEWAGCDRVFSRVDNMRDHVKRIHMKAVRRATTRS